MNNVNNNVLIAEDFEKVISKDRFKTFLDLANQNKDKAVDLYNWNLNLSSEFFSILHIYEISLRNACSEALLNKIGMNWTHERGFHNTLQKDYKEDIIRLSNKYIKNGKIIAELKFSFWQALFITSHINRLWNNELYKVFPNMDNTKDIKTSIEEIYKTTGKIRKFRNRIAHHEPILTYNHIEYLDYCLKIIGYRDINVANYYKNSTRIYELLNNRPRIL